MDGSECPVKVLTLHRGQACRLKEVLWVELNGTDVIYLAQQPNERMNTSIRSGDLGNVMRAVSITTKLLEEVAG